MPATPVTEINNHDILGLVRRIHRFQEELIHSVSSGISQFKTHDLTRLRTYLKALVTYKAWATNQPELDLPESHPQAYVLPAGPDVVTTENESVADCLTHLDLLYREIVACQSARRSGGMLPFDSVRFDALIGKMEAFLTDFVDEATPLDLPESSPKVPATGHGR